MGAALCRSLAGTDLLSLTHLFSTQTTPRYRLFLLMVAFCYKGALSFGGGLIRKERELLTFRPGGISPSKCPLHGVISTPWRTLKLVTQKNKAQG